MSKKDNAEIKSFNTCIGKRGYTIFKEELKSSEIQKIRKDLTVQAFVNQNYGVNSVPLSYLINRDGFVVRGYPSAIIGEYWTSALRSDIIKFLDNPSNNPLYK